MELTSPDRWRHVSGVDNPADCASRGLYPSELVNHRLWWNGPEWLVKTEDEWPVAPILAGSVDAKEEKEVYAFVSSCAKDPLPMLDKYSSFNRLKRVTAWIRRFVTNCRLSHGMGNPIRGFLSVKELWQAEKCWLQESTFAEDIQLLKRDKELSKKSPLLPLR